MASTSSNVNAFVDEPKFWSVPDSKKKQEDDTQWFFDHIDDTYVELEPHRWDKGPKPKVKWDRNDNDLPDFLLKGKFPIWDAMPDLCSLSSFEDPAWEFLKDSGLDGLDDFSYITGTSFFDEQTFEWAKAKQFDPSKATSTESGNNVSILEPFDDDFGDGISAITSPATSQAQKSPVSVEKVCGYRAKIANTLAPTKKFIVRTGPLDAWPDDEVDSPIPLLIQVPAQEVARRIVVMQQRMKSQEELESLSKSQDETVRLEGELRLRELWITSYKKKTKTSLSQDQSTTTLVWI